MGIIPALGMMTPGQNPPFGPIVLSPGKLLLWSLGLAFFGVFIAVPLRTQTIIKAWRSNFECVHFRFSLCFCDACMPKCPPGSVCAFTSGKGFC